MSKPFLFAILHALVICSTFIPLFILSSQRSSDSIRSSQLEDAVYNLAKTADTVYNLGPGSMKAVTITIPNGVNDTKLTGKGIFYHLMVNDNIDMIHATSKADLIEQIEYFKSVDKTKKSLSCSFLNTLFSQTISLLIKLY